MMNKKVSVSCSNNHSSYFRLSGAKCLDNNDVNRPYHHPVATLTDHWETKRSETSAVKHCS